MKLTQLHKLNIMKHISVCKPIFPECQGSFLYCQETHERAQIKEKSKESKIWKNKEIVFV